jgi:hypothetical protein
MLSINFLDSANQLGKIGFIIYHNNYSFESHLLMIILTIYIYTVYKHKNK